MLSYFIHIPRGKIVLWCYLIWYATTVYFYFDPSPRLWLNSLGISAVIGIALLLSVSRPAGTPIDFWQSARLFAMPFGVSSFSSLIKEKGFIFIIPPHRIEQAVAVGACALFVVLIVALKRGAKSFGAAKKSSH